MARVSTSFPTEFDAVLLGKSREAGKFEDGDRTIEYPDAYDISFESSEGLIQTTRVSLKALDEAADFDVEKAPALTRIHCIGDVTTGEYGKFRPSQIRKAA